MPYFVEIRDSGAIAIAEGEDVKDALGNTLGIDYYLEAKQKLVCAETHIGPNKHDVTATYAIDTVTKPYSYILADVMPLSSHYQSIIGKRFNTKEELAQAVKDITR